ncbi:lantibiotic dehydratase family protein [Maribacter sp. 2307UL18-2]|uniref:lantibiotic dehydratase family protein n=1 Tax=Maribacter sp. 2307UL18-2 TaxID=3386274 RepID=UPI0039BCEAE9
MLVALLIPKSMNINPYEPLSDFVIRTPLLELNFFKTLTEGCLITKECIIEKYKDPVVKEAIFLASPTLYFEVEKWIKNDLDHKKEEKVKLSLLKYLSRMSSRCTPFGLFAGCGIGTFANETTVAVDKYINHTRFTRPDMNYLVSLSQSFARRSHIKAQLKFFPNSSLYISGDKVRYVEYFYEENKRRHRIVEIDNSNYLRKILNRAKSGAKINELANEILDEYHIIEEIISFIEQLIDSQVLTSELEPSVSGPPPLDQILKTIEYKKDCEKEVVFLKSLKSYLNDLDNNLGNQPSDYLSISNHIETENTDFQLKYLFQTDMELSMLNCRLSYDMVDELKDVMSLLNRISKPDSNNDLEKFKDAFLETYESREMPLSQVLDVDTGIGYVQNQISGDINPLVDDLILPFPNDSYKSSKINWDIIDQRIMDKVVDAYNGNLKKIVVVEDDFKDLPIRWNDLPNTMSTITELIDDDGKIKLKLSGFGGSSGANLLGRFCHEKSALTSHTKRIVEFEESIESNRILAEIVHLPEARAGNILMRPNFRKYEIPYLSKSQIDYKQQIPLGDLFISVRNNRIVLKSKKLEKEIIPHLTNAHNFSANSLPIYHFLCDMQTQGLRVSINFGHSFLFEKLDFFPRVEYKNVILKVARWKVLKTEIQFLCDSKEDISKLKDGVNQLRLRRGIPKMALLTEGDNELLINMENMTSVLMLLETVKNRKEFILSEFLHGSNQLMNDGRCFANQFVFTFYNSKKKELETLNYA